MGRVVASLVGFGVSALLARILSPEDMAIFFLANSVAIFLALNYRFGFDNLLLQKISESLSADNVDYAKALVIVGLGMVGVVSLFSAMLLYFGPGHFLLTTFFSSQPVEGFLGLIIIWSIVLAFQFLLSEIFRAFKEISLAVIVGGALTSLLSLGSLFSLSFVGGQEKLEVVLSLVIISGLINVFIGIKKLHKRIRGVRRDIVSAIRIKALFNDGWPFWGHAITHYIIGFSGLWILGRYAEGLDVANYGAAIRLTALIAMALLVVNSVVSPLIAGMNLKGERKKMERILRGSATLASVPSLIIILIFFIFAENTMVFVFGEPYESGSSILRILLFGHLVAVLSGAHGYLLMMSGHQKTMMFITLVSAILTIAMSMLVIVPFGVIGIAWVTSVIIALQQLASLLLSHLKTGVWCHFSIGKMNEFVKKDLLKERQ